MIKLDSRLKALLDDIKGPVVADIGCDHGKLSVSALIKNKADKVIAVDISPLSLNKTIELANSECVSDRVDCRVSDGFEAITESLDTAVIAGLGGYEIKDILSKRVPQINRLIICPHQNAAVARKAINEFGFGAIKDYVTKSGDKFYQIIVAEKDAPAYAEEELRFGKNYPQNDDYLAMIKSRKKVLEDRFEGRSIPEGEMLKEYEELVKLCSR
ncbi:MAG: SAM-dependent methyltransferase [Clostridia bacterium]|nr:SAM-dependent methyltransferase [Clostridia bacterium]